MLAVRIICIILLVNLFLLLLRVGVVVTIGEDTTLAFRIGPFCKRISLDRVAAKPRKKAAEPTETSAPKAAPKRHSLPKPTAAECIELLQTLFDAMGRVIRRTCRRIRFDPFILFICFGGSDPALVAQAYGYANALMWWLMPRAEDTFYMVAPEIHLGMDFDAEKTMVEGKIGISVRPIDLFSIGFALLLPMAKWAIRFLKAHKNDPAPSEETPVQDVDTNSAA